MKEKGEIRNKNIEVDEYENLHEYAPKISKHLKVPLPTYLYHICIISYRTITLKRLQKGGDKE